MPVVGVVLTGSPRWWRRHLVAAEPGPARPHRDLYAFTSMANNNGSAFAGLTGNTRPSTT
jgi:K+-transporting ATPase A subunit